MDDLLFCRGYCLIDFTTDKLPASFNKINLDDRYHFYFHNWIDCQVVRKEKDWILISGTCLDIKNNTADLKEIGKELFDLLQKNKRNEFHQHLDFLGGTFIVCFSIDDNVEFYTDCCAIKSAFYTRVFGKTCVTSHLDIIPLIYNIEFPLSDVVINRPNSVSYSYSYPGNDTRYRNVLILTPNTYLSIESLEINRFFPTHNIESSDIDSAINNINNAFSIQMSLLLKEKDYEKTYLSLTAGLDSRFTLACVRDFWSDLSFFTYNQEGLQQKDIDRAKDIAKLLNLDSHIPLDIPKVLSFDENEGFSRFNKILNNNTNLNHGRKIAYFYYKYLTENLSIHPKNILHIRSNLSEIGRVYYGVFAYYWDMIGKKTPTLDKIRQAYQNKSDKFPVIDQSFSQFIEKNQFNDIKNYDVFDMFYWEHRMGTFISQVAIESDPAFETINLFNVRFLLKNLLSLSLSERNNDILFKKVIKDKLPELSELPIN